LWFVAVRTDTDGNFKLSLSAIVINDMARKITEAGGEPVVTLFVQHIKVFWGEKNTINYNLSINYIFSE
jgi:hypothetical protein